MESSAVTRYNPQKSNKRVFPGSSSAIIEPEVIEITPPHANRTPKSKSKALKHKEVVHHEIIDVDMDEDRNDVVFVEANVESNKKRKGSSGISLGPSITNQVSINKSQNQTTKKVVDSNKKGKDIANSMGFGHSMKNSQTFFDIDNYVIDDEFMALQSHFDNMDIPTGVEAQIPWFPENLQTKKSSSSSAHVSSTYTTNFSNTFTQTTQKTHHQSSSYSTFTYDQVGVGGSYGSIPSTYAYDQLGVGGGYGSSFFQPSMNTPYPPGADPSFPMYPPGDTLMDQVVTKSSTRNSSVKGSSSNMPKAVDNENVLKKYESFKKFDTVVDFSDHYYARQNPGSKQPPKNWSKKIQDEWRILEKDLPDTIFVRAYESRMDLLRAVITGAEGTPYHDGLFFFDICFPSNYPSSPPLVHYHSGGLRINPNLYNCGKVCLSLLNTWTGGHKERWVPGTSTMLQVLVSIQGLILNMKPYFNEPGYAHSSGSAHGEKRSVEYNENTLILSLKTMIYSMKNPPKNFEDLVTGHFRNRVRDILMACKAYTEGVQVGCLVRGGVQDLDEGNNASCSAKFKDDVATVVKSLITAFKNIGAKEADEFVGLSEKKSRPARASTRLPHVPAPAVLPYVNGYGLPVPPPPPPPPQLPYGGGGITAFNNYW